MGRFHLPAGTQIGHVHLQVSDSARALAFYRDLLGFRQVDQNGTTAALSATGEAPYHILLTEQPGARPKPRGTTGLYHVAIRLPDRLALAQTLQRLTAYRWPFQGFSDHGVSEALYLADPDGNGLELYMDRPREQWPRQNDQIAMTTDPLDVETLMAEAGQDSTPWTGIHPETDIGHVHLHVSDLARAEAFYHGVLGLDVTQRGYPGALFLAAGGYHHHLGINVWAGEGAPSPPPNAVGLVSFSLEIPDRQTWRTLMHRVQESGLPIEGPGEAPTTGPRFDKSTESALVRDPDHNSVALVTTHADSLT